MFSDKKGRRYKLVRRFCSRRMDRSTGELEVDSEHGRWRPGGRGVHQSQGLGLILPYRPTGTCQSTGWQLTTQRSASDPVYGGRRPRHTPVWSLATKLRLTDGLRVCRVLPPRANIRWIVPSVVATGVPVTDVLPATSWITVEPLTTARSKPAETVAPSVTPVALVAGLRVVTTGAGVGVVNDHVTGVIDAHRPRSARAGDRRPCRSRTRASGAGGRERRGVGRRRCRRSFPATVVRAAGR